jgi:hypothetical protein
MYRMGDLTNFCNDIRTLECEIHRHAQNNQNIQNDFRLLFSVAHFAYKAVQNSNNAHFMNAIVAIS